MSELLEKIRSCGYWNIAIHPNEFVPERVDRVSKLYPILRNTSVRLRGWDFPHLNPMLDPRKEDDWIEQEFGGAPFLEIWRFYQSGQFVDVSSVPYDWNDSALYKSGSIINVADSIYRLTEAFELAARLSLTEAGSLFMHVEITHANLSRRWLDFNGIKDQYSVRGCKSKETCSPSKKTSLRSNSLPTRKSWPWSRQRNFSSNSVGNRISTFFEIFNIS